MKSHLTEQFASMAYQARHATPDEGYTKSHDEALAKLTSAVAAMRETARLFSEVASKN